MLTTTATSERQPRRIVIVDDDPAHVQVVKLILTRELNDLRSWPVSIPCCRISPIFRIIIW